MSIIEIDKINKNYGKTVALKDISFSVNKGEIFGLVGPDGVGKSTLFNIMATILFADSGKITVSGKDIEKNYLEIRQIIGYLPGTFSLYQDLSVEENLSFFAVMYRSNLATNMELIKPIWDQLVPFRNRKAGKLSGGMKQKLALCCALIHKPSILFLDEPTTGVDPVSRKEFWKILKLIQKQNVTVVVSTPYMDEALRCDRIALFKKSEIIDINTPSQIISNFKGVLFSLKTNSIFELLENMKNCHANIVYYPYGEYLHLIFYNFDSNNTINQFISFLDSTNTKYSELEQISPSIEDCFIELIELRKNNV